MKIRTQNSHSVPRKYITVCFKTEFNPMSPFTNLINIINQLTFMNNLKKIKILDNNFYYWLF